MTSASMNVWLHKQVMIKLAEHGGKVPELLTAQTAMTDQEAKAWVGKDVYSSDGNKLGEVAAILRTADNKITELRADIGGCWASASVKSLFRRLGSPCRMTALCST